MLALYIHVPFCVRKCRYCGFYSTEYSSYNADAFISGIQFEARSYRDEFRNRSFSSVYIGGGTPTVLTPEQFSRLVGLIREYFTIDDGVEFTVEANPKTVTQERLSILYSLGVNRLSLGVQSFSDEVLQILGRFHTAEQTANALRYARSTGFENIGVDLMYGIPGQTLANWKDTLDTTIAFKPVHVSTYSLSLDDGSQFMREAAAGTFALPDEDICAEMYESAVTKLNYAGYERYEISNFTVPGYECRHNMRYWERGEYLGLGPGACSFISGRRYANIADTTEYAHNLSRGLSQIGSQEIVDSVASARETVFLSLRTAKGLDLSGFEQEFGPELLRRLEMNSLQLRDKGLLQVKDGCMTLSDRGILLSNEVLARLSV